MFQPSSKEFIKNSERLNQLSGGLIEDDCDALNNEGEKKQYRLWQPNNQCFGDETYRLTKHNKLACCYNSQGIDTSQVRKEEKKEEKEEKKEVKKQVNPFSSFFANKGGTTGSSTIGAKCINPSDKKTQSLLKSQLINRSIGEAGSGRKCEDVAGRYPWSFLYKCYGDSDVENCGDTGSLLASSSSLLCCKPSKFAIDENIFPLAGAGPSGLSGSNMSTLSSVSNYVSQFFNYYQDVTELIETEMNDSKYHYYYGSSLGDIISSRNKVLKDFDETKVKFRNYLASLVEGEEKRGGGPSSKVVGGWNILFPIVLETILIQEITGLPTGSNDIARDKRLVSTFIDLLTRQLRMAAMIQNEINQITSSRLTSIPVERNENITVPKILSIISGGLNLFVPNLKKLLDVLTEQRGKLLVLPPPSSFPYLVSVKKGVQKRGLEEGEVEEEEGKNQGGGLEIKAGVSTGTSTGKRRRVFPKKTEEEKKEEEKENDEEFNNYLNNYFYAGELKKDEDLNDDQLLAQETARGKLPSSSFPVCGSSGRLSSSASLDFENSPCGQHIRQVEERLSREEKREQKFKNYQKAVVKQLLKPSQHGVIAFHSTGSGKTLTAAISIYCVLLNYPEIKDVIVLTLGTTISYWLSELSKVDFPKNYEMYPIRSAKDIIKLKESRAIKRERGTRSGGGPSPDIRHIYIMTVDSFVIANRQDILKCDNVFFVVDEAHHLKAEIKGKTGKEPKVAVDCAMNGKASKVLLLSGGIVPNDPYDIVNLVSMAKGIEPMKKKDFNKMMKNDSFDPSVLNEFLSCVISYFDCSWSSVAGAGVGASVTGGEYPSVNEIYETIVMPPDYYLEYDKVEQKELSKLVKKNQKKSVRQGTDPHIFLTGLRSASDNIEIEGNGKNPKVVWLEQKIFNDPKFINQKTLIYSNYVQSGLGPVADMLDDKSDVKRVEMKKLEITKKAPKKKKPLSYLSTSGPIPSSLQSLSGEEEKEEGGMITSYTYKRIGQDINLKKNRLYVEIQGDVPLFERNLGIARFNAAPGQIVVVNNNEPDDEKKIKIVDRDSEGGKRAIAGQISGDYQVYTPVNIMLIGPAGGEGLNLTRTRNVVIMEPAWNRKTTAQAIARAAGRLGSHRGLPLEEQHVDVYHLLLDKPKYWKAIIKQVYPPTKPLLIDPIKKREDVINRLRRKELLDSGIDVVMQNIVVNKQKQLDYFLDRVIENAINDNDNDDEGTRCG